MLVLEFTTIPSLESPALSRDEGLINRLEREPVVQSFLSSSLSHTPPSFTEDGAGVKYNRGGGSSYKNYFSKMLGSSMPPRDSIHSLLPHILGRQQNTQSFIIIFLMFSFLFEMASVGEGQREPDRGSE